eukprot:scaffold923_cov256-Pinguiococcus_pyrenoidosus.AAC.30
MSDPTSPVRASYSSLRPLQIHGTVNDYRTIDDRSSCDGGCQGDTAVHEWGHAFGENGQSDLQERRTLTKDLVLHRPAAHFSKLLARSV